MSQIRARALRMATVAVAVGALLAGAPGAVSSVSAQTGGLCCAVDCLFGDCWADCPYGGECKCSFGFPNCSCQPNPNPTSPTGDP